jgi:hypothetical protein
LLATEQLKNGYVSQRLPHTDNITQRNRTNRKQRRDKQRQKTDQNGPKLEIACNNTMKQWLNANDAYDNNRKKITPGSD